MTQVSGEETLDILFGNGLFISESDDDIPDGYNAIQTNMFLDSLGHLNLRATFQTAGTYIQPAAEPREDPRWVAPKELYPPDYPFDYLRRVHYPYNPPIITIGSPTTYVNYPSVVLPRMLTPAGVETTVLFSVNSNGINGVGTAEQSNAAFYAGLYPHGMAQYRDRIYFCLRDPNYTTTGVIVYFTGWDYDGTPGTYTTNNIALIPTNDGFTGIVTFRDRMFAWHNDKIYFTEVAAIGGYPETFSANNVILVQSAEARAVIHNIIPLKDKLYIFTDRGMYQLYAVGPSSGWYLQTVSTQYRIFGKNGVCLVNDTIVFTDRSKIYVYGDSFQEIGKEIGLIINQSDSVTVNPFEDGIIVSCHEMTANPTTHTDYEANYWTLDAARHFYFNGSSWAEIEIHDDSSTPRIFAILGSIVNHITYAGESKPYSYITIVDEVVTTPDPTFYVLYYDRESLAEDTINSVACTVVGRLRTKKYRNTKPTAYIRIKHAFVNIMTYLNQIDTIGWIRDAGTQLDDTISGTAIVDTADHSHVKRFRGTDVASKYSFNLVIDSFHDIAAAATDKPRTLFRLRNIWGATNTDNTTVVNSSEP